MDKPIKIYGKRLRELREQNGYTQETLSKILNISRSSIAMYEQGKRQPDFETQEAIADLFNVPLDYLFGRDSKQVRAFYDYLYKEGDMELTIERLSPEDRQQIADIEKQLIKLTPENRTYLLNLLKSLSNNT